MNVKQLREAIKDLPNDMRVKAWTTGDTEFSIAIVTIYNRPHMWQPVLFLGNDPDEFNSLNEKLLYKDDVE